MSTQEIISGGWTPYHTISSEEKAVFDEALKGFGDVIYRPITLSTEVVEGINYRFKCTATKPPAYVIWDATVEIYQPINGKPYVTGIRL